MMSRSERTRSSISNKCRKRETEKEGGRRKGGKKEGEKEGENIPGSINDVTFVHHLRVVVTRHS